MMRTSMLHRKDLQGSSKNCLKILYQLNSTILLVRIPSLVVMGDDSCLEVVGSNPGAVY